MIRWLKRGQPAETARRTAKPLASQSFDLQLGVDRGDQMGARQELFGGSYHEAPLDWAYHNQFWIEDGMQRTLMARGVFRQPIYIDPEAEFAAVILSNWPDFVYPAGTRAAITAVKAIRDFFTIS